MCTHDNKRSHLGSSWILFLNLEVSLDFIQFLTTCEASFLGATENHNIHGIGQCNFPHLLLPHGRPHTRQACRGSPFMPLFFSSVVKSSMMRFCSRLLLLVVIQSWSFGKYAVFAPETWNNASRNGKWEKFNFTTSHCTQSVTVYIYNVSFLVQTV